MSTLSRRATSLWDTLLGPGCDQRCTRLAVMRPRISAVCIAVSFSLLAAAPVPAPADRPDDDRLYRFGRLSLENGLSHNVIYSMLQDRYGFLWFGTEDGLNKYDGHSFILYRNDPQDSLTLSDNWITALLEDEVGNLWVGTRHGGLNRFDRETETFERYPFRNCDSDDCLSPTRLNSPDVTALLEHSSGDIWIGTFGGLSRLDPSSDRFEHFIHESGNPRSLSNNRVWCLAEDADGVLWVGTWNAGLNRLARGETAFTQYRQDHVDGPHINSDRIRALVSGEDGILWVGTSGGGLNRFDTQTGQVEAFVKGENTNDGLPDNRVWALHQDRRGILWIGTYGAGLARFDPEEGKFQTFEHAPDNPNSLASQVVATIAEDRSGILWLGSDRGVSRFNLAQEAHRHYVHQPNDPSSLGHTEILSLHQSELEPDVVWIGTHGGGLDRFDTRDASFHHITSGAPTGRGLSSDIVNDIAEDVQRGHLWLATRGGLTRVDMTTLEISTFRHDPTDENSPGSDAVMSVLVDRENTVWSGTDGGGISRYFPESGRFIRYSHDPFDPTSLSDHSIRTIFQDTKDRIWIGTVDGGLNLFHPETETFTAFRHRPGDPNTLWHNRVVALHEDERGHLWIGTHGGVNRLDLVSGEFERFDEKDGLPNEPYVAIQSDGEGGLWMTASNRLTHFNPQTRRARHFTDRNGLSPNHYSANSLVLRDGEILLAGSNGMSRFTPPLADNAHVRNPPLVITAFKKMDEVVSREIFGKESITLSHSDRFFTLEFVVLDFTNPEKHRYQYVLEGYDTEWQQLSGSIGRASYANFRPSKTEYRFRIRAANSQGAWNNTWLRVIVVPPWWETIWFRLSALLAIGLVVGSVVWYSYNRRATLRAETLRLLAEGRERERHYLARELHDVPLQNLYSIRHKLEVLGRYAEDGEQQDSFKELHDVLDKTAEDLRILCGELRPPSLATFGLEKAIRSHVRTVRRSHPHLQFHLNLTPDGRDLSDHLRHSLFRIYQSALTNVLRHSGATALWITFVLDQDRVTLEIRDNGCGFRVPRSFLTLARSEHYGLLGMSEWADSIGAEFSVDSKTGIGTTIHVAALRRDDR